MERSKDIVIAVMGASGTGKSSFINLASGGQLATGNGIRSCTSDVAYSCAFELFGRRIVLLDTPGFNHTTCSDADILKTLATHFSTTYEAGVILSGVIYMHCISDVRMNGVSRRNFNMFRKLCGEDALRNAIIVTTRWSEVSPEIGARRERELMTDDHLFKPVLDEGAQMVRHDDTIPSTLSILARMIQNRVEPLRIQRELIDKNLDINDTAAGRELSRIYATILRKFKEDLSGIQKEMSEALAARDMEARLELEVARQDLIKLMSNIEQDRNNLRKEFMEEKRQASREVYKLQAQMKAEKEEDTKRVEFEQLHQEPAKTATRSQEELHSLRQRLEYLELTIESPAPRMRYGF